MAACNKFSESVLHTACRRSTYPVVEFLVNHDADVYITDDYGRCSLHDACWRLEPDFQIISLILDKDTNLIWARDQRDFTPLKYIREEHYMYWCIFLYEKRDKYWPKDALK